MNRVPIFGGNLAASPAACALFVVRALGAPPRLRHLLAAERSRYGDILEVGVPWNETRLRGPVMTLAAWVAHAATHLPFASYVAKVDDDSYLHAPGLAQVLLTHVHPRLPHPRAYIGPLTWYSWFPKQWDRCGFGWTWHGANAMGQFCRNASWAAQRCANGCGEAVGPFPFAAGYLIVLSAPLAKAIGASPDLKPEIDRLSASGRLTTHKGFTHTQIFEDVWLGSFIHTYLSPGPPIAYLNLFRSEIVVDLDQTQWGSTVRPSALLVHIRSKEPRIFVATHDFLNASRHCRESRRMRSRSLSCAHGCGAFGTPPRHPSSRLCAAAPPDVLGASSTFAASASSWCSMRAFKDMRTLPSCMAQNLKPRVKAIGSYVRATEILQTAKSLLQAASRQARNGGDSPSAGRGGRQLSGGGGSGVVAGSGGSGGGGVAGRRGWRSHGSVLQASVHVAQLRPDGSLEGIPEDASVVIEVGANTRNTLDRELLPSEPKAFLISFEPLLDKYASLLARNSRPDTRVPLGRHHARGLVLPFAVSADANAVREFKISGATDGCASLLDPVASYYSPSCTNLSGVLERRAVPTVSLEVVLSSWLKGRDVQLAKVDAQGLDVGVIRSAGSQVGRLKAVQMEVVRDRPPLKCTPQYAAEEGRDHSEAKCGVLVRAMAELGFRPYDTNCLVHKFKEAGGCEAEMMFVRDGFDEKLVRGFCMNQRPHSCGPGAWSLPADRGSWDAATKAWAAEVASRWPPPSSPPPKPAKGRAAGVRTLHGRGARALLRQQRARAKPL